MRKRRRACWRPWVTRAEAGGGLDENPLRCSDGPSAVALLTQRLQDIVESAISQVS